MNQDEFRETSEAIESWLSLIGALWFRLAADRSISRPYAPPSQRIAEIVESLREMAAGFPNAAPVIEANQKHILRVTDGPYRFSGAPSQASAHDVALLVVKQFVDSWNKGPWTETLIKVGSPFAFTGIAADPAIQSLLAALNEIDLDCIRSFFGGHDTNELLIRIRIEREKAISAAQGEDHERSSEQTKGTGEYIPMSRKAVADFFRISEKTVREWHQKGYLQVTPEQRKVSRLETFLVDKEWIESLKKLPGDKRARQVSSRCRGKRSTDS